MKRILSLLLLVPALCWGQTYPSPTFQGATLLSTGSSTANKYGLTIVQTATIVSRGVYDNVSVSDIQ